ncbi:alpha/beta hydrolase [Rhodococcus sp. (in: high G+C Gram-positive bacteria)]|uniref:alpha/beta hydrolase n=1 Tax=Rhodococcus sp. TaxID=1831 RepID=UPI00257B9330|nr:alpha/beta hydrolase [Rhodococcus sp. (in: high G+C Gram-positive bacteria)]MBQ7806094.1 alpha/beta hydrolase [Rhodococcus sp. (in: high G+C Gram-positive bacteria)]
MSDDALTRANDLLRSLVPAAEPTIDSLRADYERFCANFEVPSDAEIVDVSAGGVPAIWVSAPGAAAENVVILLHGGGWTMGSAHGYREFAYRVSRASDARVLVVDYRLAPENPFPAAVDDALAAYHWVERQDDVSKIAFVGDSSGGGLVLSVMIRLRDEGSALPAAGVLCSPLVDLAGEGRSLTERAHLDPLPVGMMLSAMGAGYLAGRDPKETPLASPLYADLHDLPPLRVLVGTNEGLYDDSVRLVEKVQAAQGHAELEIGEGMIHTWPLFDFLPKARESTDRFGKFLRHEFAAAKVHN